MSNLFESWPVAYGRKQTKVAKKKGNNDDILVFYGFFFFCKKGYALLT